MSNTNQPASKGRPRDDHAHSSVLQAALKLLHQHGYAHLTIDAIAKAAGVSRPTIYRWWDHKAEIVLEALLSATASAAAYGNSGDLATDLKQHAREYARLLSGPLGNAYRAIFAEGLADQEFMVKVRHQLIGPRRALTKSILKEAINRQELENTDFELLIDALYAPFFYRLLLGHLPINDDFAEGIIDFVMKGKINVAK
jgi:AcrR family transcriptional regulator